jgi:hypothetical protein
MSIACCSSSAASKDVWASRTLTALQQGIVTFACAAHTADNGRTEPSLDEDAQKSAYSDPGSNGWDSGTSTETAVPLNATTWLATRTSSTDQGFIPFS